MQAYMKKTVPCRTEDGKLRGTTSIYCRFTTAASRVQMLIYPHAVTGAPGPAYLDKTPVQLTAQRCISPQKRSRLHQPQPLCTVFWRYFFFSLPVRPVYKSQRGLSREKRLWDIFCLFNAEFVAFHRHQSAVCRLFLLRAAVPPAQLQKAFFLCLYNKHIVYQNGQFLMWSFYSLLFYCYAAVSGVTVLPSL